MTFKTIATVLSPPVTEALESGAAVPGLDAAIALAQAEGAHLDVIALGIDRTVPEYHYLGASPAILAENHAVARQEAEALAKAAVGRLAGYDLVSSVQPLVAQMPAVAPVLGHALRCADVAVVPRPYGEAADGTEAAIVETALFVADLPVLVAPGPALPRRFGRIVVAWNESPEAMRAVRAALPMIARADLVEVAIVDPPRHGPDQADPGGDLCRMIARHGARAEVAVLPRTVPRIADVLTARAQETGADLIVMGAYGHSRLREAILGGATRNMLERAAVPVLLKH